MRRESLWRLKTHDDVNTANDILRVKDIRTLSTLSGLEANTPVLLDERALAMALARDRQRLTRQTEAVERSQRRLLAMRAKLKARKQWNQRIQEQRQQLMKLRHRGLPAPSPAAGQPHAEVRTVAHLASLVVTY